MRAGMGLPARISHDRRNAYRKSLVL